MLFLNVLLSNGSSSLGKYESVLPCRWVDDELLKDARVSTVMNVIVRVCSFLRHPKTNVPPESIRNEPLLCPHKKFLFNPECDVEDNGANEE